MTGEDGAGSRMRDWAFWISVENIVVGLFSDTKREGEGGVSQGSGARGAFAYRRRVVGLMESSALSRLNSTV